MQSDSTSSRPRSTRPTQIDVEDLSQLRMRAHDRQTQLRRRFETVPDPAVAAESLSELEGTIEELQVAEEELRQQNEDLQSTRFSAEAAQQRYEELFELAPDGYLVTTPDGVIREINRAALRLFASARSFASAKPIAIFFEDESRRAARALMLRLATEERVDDVELTLKPREGEPFAVAITASAVRDVRGRTIALRWLVRDARERVAARNRLTALAEQLEARVAERTRQLDAARRLHEELFRLEHEARATAERAQERLRFLASASAVLAEAEGVSAVLATAARLTVPVLGEWCVTIAPTEPDAEIGPDALVEVAHDDPGQAQLADTLRRRMAGAEGMPRAVVRAMARAKAEVVADLADWNDAASAADAAHLRLLHALGMRSLMTVPLTARGRTLGVMCCISTRPGRRYDETDVRAAEDVARTIALALDGARRLERAEREAAAAEGRARRSGQGVAMLMHDVRTPLSAIGGYADLLTLGAYGPLTAPQTEAVGRLHAGYDYLLELVDNVQSFARLENGVHELDAQAFDLDTLLDELYPQLENALRARGLHYEVRRGATPMCLESDPASVRRVLVNLLSNAVKFTPNGGRITVEWEADRRDVRIHVRDTGRGIPPERLETVFEPFSQVAPRDASERRGVGLGLAIARRLARALGGDVLVASVPGEGSTFTLRLPLVRHAARVRGGG